MSVQDLMKRIALVGLVALMLGACLGSDIADSIEGSWELRSGTWDGQPIPLVDSHPITATFEGEDLSGTAACNTYSGRWQVSGGFFQLAEVAWTEMACMPVEVMDSESAYLEALLNVEDVEVIDGELVMVGSRAELTFVSRAKIEPVG